MTKLSVNIDHVATVRQARRATYPDPIVAARLAEGAGASGITAHLRSDRRHVQDDDLSRLKNAVRGKLNVEMAATDEMVAIACRLHPDQVTLVPERPEEITTEGGLDLLTQGPRVASAARALKDRQIDVSVFVDPELAQIDRLAELAPGLVDGFEINTDAYTRAGSEDVGHHLDLMAQVAELGHQRGFRVYAGHGLTVANVGPVSDLPHMEELNIGHALVARAVIVGLEAAVREMLAAMDTAG